MRGQRKEWGSSSSPRMAQSHSTGTAQWGAAVTLRALQSESVPIHEPTLYQKQSLATSSQPTASYTANGMRRPSRTRSEQPYEREVYQRPSYQRAPSSASGSGGAGPDSNQRGSDATVRPGMLSMLGVYQPPSSRSGSQNNIALGLKPSPMALRTQSALGVYRPTEDISPRQLTFDGSAYFPSQPSSQQQQMPAWNTQAHQPSTLSVAWTPPAPQHAQQVYDTVPITRQSQQRQVRQPFYTPREEMQEIMPASPVDSDLCRSPPHSARSLASNSSSQTQKSPYERYQPLHMLSTPEHEHMPMSAEQMRQHLRTLSMSQAKCNAEIRHASVISIPPTMTADIMQQRQRSQTESVTTRKTSEFMKQYGLQLDESQTEIRGGWDEDSEDERGGMLSPSSSSNGRKVTISENVCSSPASPSKSGRTGALFKKAFYKSGGGKRVSRNAVSRKPVPSSSPRSILRNRPPSLILGSPRLSASSSLSPSTPGSFFCADSAVMNNSALQRETYERLLAEQQQRKQRQVAPEAEAGSRRGNRASVAPITPQIPPRRRGSVGVKNDAGITGSRHLDKRSTPEDNGEALRSIQADLSRQVETSPSTVNSRLSLDGSNGRLEETDDTSSVNSAQLLTIQKVGLRTASDADSIGSAYDQESWDGDSRRGSVNTPGASIALNAPVFRASEELSADGDDEGDSELFEDAQQDFGSVPTKYKIVRTSGDDSRDVEFLDSIHVYDRGAAAGTFDEEASQASDSAYPCGDGDQNDEDVVEVQATSAPVRRMSTLKACQDAKVQYETLEVNRYLADYGKHVKAVRTSGFFDSTAMTAHSWPRKEDWKDAHTGKLNTVGFIASTMISTFTYLSPVHFRDVHETHNDGKEIPRAPEEEAAFHMDALKSSAERLFLSAVPIYERAFLSARQLWRWDSKLRSAFWSVAYFTLWYSGMLLSSFLALVIFAVLSNQSERNTSERLQMLADQKRRARAVRQIHTNDWSEIVREAQSPSGAFASSDVVDAADAIRRYGPALTVLSTRMSDAHERMRNMVLWVRTPATVRTLVVLFMAMLISTLITPAMLLRLPGLLFGVIFFLLAPLIERRWLLTTASTVDPLEFLLAGVPNDAQNAKLIIRRRMQAMQDAEREEKEDGERMPDSPREKSSYIDASTDLLDDSIWPTRKTLFAASYEGSMGALSVTHDRMVFRMHSESYSHLSPPSSPSLSSKILLDVLLERVVRIDKITIHPFDAKSSLGLRISVRQAGNTIALHTLTHMDARDQAFNYVMALAPQRWQKQRPGAA